MQPKNKISDPLNISVELYSSTEVHPDLFSNIL